MNERPTERSSVHRFPRTPPPWLLRRVLITGTTAWAAMRAFGLTVGFVGRPPIGTAALAATVTLAVWVSMRRSNEILLLENLGIRPTMVTVVSVVLVTVLEASMWVLIGVIA